MKRTLKEKLSRREVTFGSWVQIGHPAVMEILKANDYEWLAIDCEHTEIDVNNFAALARTRGASNINILARVKANDTIFIRQVLDLGANGVIVPLVNNAEDARKAVQAAKYPPLGIRGYAYCRANNYGKDFDSYVKQANKRVAVIVMIETIEAVNNITKILSIDGIDSVFIGPYDLSGSLGIPGKTDHPRVAASCKIVYDAAAKMGKSCGIHLVHPTRKNIRDAVNKGCNFIALGMDSVFLAEQARSTIQLAKNKSKLAGSSTV